ncbi:MAG: hypothetical protein R2755_23720 [Acidimicrobiales bacterium]
MRTSESAALRQKWIPTATPQHGYRRVLVIGTTGSGKTTLIRQLLGTSVERVPATSSARPRRSTRKWCLPRVTTTPWPPSCRDEVGPAPRTTWWLPPLRWSCSGPSVAAFKLFEHEDQRLRLPYVLGDPGPGPSWHEPYASILGRLGELAAAPGRGVSADDEVALEEWYRADATIDAMADELVARIEQAILRLVGGQFVRGEGNWPDVWRVQHSDRAAFFDALRQVSSNEAALFGRLLTPIVNGLRLRGPFIPAWAPAPLRVTITDSEGLGHIAETAAALPSTLVERFDEVEAIVLVDNGSQPMQAASQAALRRIATAGHLGKVIICFTHLDQVGGPNIQWEHQRQALLHHSLEQALGGLASALGPAGRSTLKQLADERTFYLGSLDRDLDLHADRPMIEELHRLVTVLHQPDATAVPVEPSRLRAEQLVEAVRQTFGEFCGRWGNRLGQRAGGAAVHWNTLKAFAGRVAQGSAEEYGELRPVAELAAILADHLNRAAAGQGWGSEPTADLSDAFLREVNRSVLASARAHLITGPQAIWALAAACKGTGSARTRSEIVANQILAPCLDLSGPTPLYEELLANLLDLARRHNSLEEEQDEGQEEASRTVPAPADGSIGPSAPSAAPSDMVQTDSVARSTRSEPAVDLSERPTVTRIAETQEVRAATTEPPSIHLRPESDRGGSDRPVRSAGGVALAVTVPPSQRLAPVAYNDQLARELRGRRLAMEIGLDGRLEELDAHVREMLRPNTTPDSMVRAYPALLVCHLAAQAIHRYRGGEFWTSVQPVSIDRAYGPAFVEALRKLKLETLDDMVEQENAQAYVSRIVAHGGIPAYCAKDFWTLITSAVRKGYRSGAELIAYWRRTPGALADIDKPVVRFLRYGDALAEDFLDRCLDHLSAASAGTTAPESAGIPRYLADALTALPRSEQQLAAGRAAGRQAAAEVCLEPWDGNGPYLWLPISSDVGANAYWEVDTGVGRVRRPVSRHAEQTVSLEPARAWGLCSWTRTSPERPPTVRALGTSRSCSSSPRPADSSVAAQRRRSPCWSCAMSRRVSAVRGRPASRRPVWWSTCLRCMEPGVASSSTGWT